MRKFALGLGCAALFGVTSTSWATLGVVVSEDFESYANTSEMLAVWSDTGGFDATLENEIDDDGDLTPEVTGIGNFAFHPGLGGFALGVAAQDLAAPIVATESEWIRLSVDIYDNDLGLNGDNKRMSLGLRAATAAENIIELGMYNNPGHFVYRAVLFDSINETPNPSWTAWDMGVEMVGEAEFPVNRFRGGAWYTYQVTIKPEALLFEFDLDYDGTFDYAMEHVDIPHTAAGFDQIRFGGPSGISSSGGGVTFDNILLEIIEADVALEGDLDDDGFVGINDLNLVLGSWNATVTPGDPADPTGDNFVGIEDLNIVLGNWNAGTPPPAVAVPEPATLALLSLGGLAMLRRR